MKQDDELSKLLYHHPEVHNRIIVDRRDFEEDVSLEYVYPKGDDRWPDLSESERMI